MKPLIDQHCPTWRAVKAHMDERDAILMRSLLTTGLSPTDTENVRGAFNELRLLRNLPERLQQANQRGEE